MNRTLGKVLMIVCLLVSASLFICFGFSINRFPYDGFFLVGLLLAISFLAIGCSIAYSLGHGRFASIYSLDRTQTYELIARTETIDHRQQCRFIYILKDSLGEIFSITSDEQCVMSTYPFTLPVSVKLHGLGGSGPYLLRVCDQPVAEVFVKTPKT